MSSLTYHKEVIGDEEIAELCFLWRPPRRDQGSFSESSTVSGRHPIAFCKRVGPQCDETLPRAYYSPLYECNTTVEETIA